MAVKKKPKPLLFLLVFIIILIVLAVGSYGLWLFLISPVNSNNNDKIKVEIKSGTSNSNIAELLEEKKIIRNALAFKIYMKINKVNSLKASTYELSQDMSVSEIIDVLEKGNTFNPDQIILTFKEGKRITDYAKLISDNTNTSYDDVIKIINDKDYLKELISNYWFLTDDILNDKIYYPLEGYLFPETYYFKDKDVEVKTIIKTMLDEMDKRLNKYKSSISSKTHYYITMASIVELEGTNTENRKMIVGIFNNRLTAGMNMGSDVTTYYGLQASHTTDLDSKQFDSVNGYNTRLPNMGGKMPVGPICSISISSLEASINPTKSDNYYFVADKYGNIYYTKTMEEHNKKIKEIKADGAWIEFKD